MTVSLSQHATSLTDGEIVEQSDLGSISRVTADNLPILQGLSIKRLVINPGAMRTPHWHANANELTYCVTGTALVSVLDNGSQFSPASPSARAKCSTSIRARCTTSRTSATEPAEFVITFRHERPEDFGLAVHSAR